MKKLNMSADCSGLARRTEPGFNALHLVPKANPNIAEMLSHSSINYTFWLNLVFGALALWLVFLNWRNPMDHGDHHEHQGHDVMEEQQNAAALSKPSSTSA